MSTIASPSSTSSVATQESFHTVNFDWPGFYYYTVSKLAEDVDAANSNNGSSKSNSESTIVSLFRAKPIVLLAGEEKINVEAITNFTDLSDKKILAINYGFYRYLTDETRTQLPPDVKSKLFISENSDQPNKVANFFVPFIHSLNFLIHYKTNDSNTELTNFEALFNYVKDALKKEKSPAAPFGLTAMKENIEFPDELLKEEGIALFEMLDLLDAGACVVYNYLKDMLETERTRPKSLSHWLQIQQGLGEGIGSRPLPKNLMIKYGESHTVYGYLRSIQTIEKTFNGLFDQISLKDSITLDEILPLQKLEDTAKTILKDARAVPPPRIRVGANKHELEQSRKTAEENEYIVNEISQIFSKMSNNLLILKTKLPQKIPSSLPSGAVPAATGAGPAGGDVPAATGAVPAATGAVPAITNVESIEAFIEQYVNIESQEQIKDEGPLGADFTPFHEYHKIQTPGMGNCAISAVLTAISPSYRKITDDKVKNQISVAIRPLIAQMKNADGQLIFNQTEINTLCNTDGKIGEYIDDKTICKFVNAIGLNLIQLISYRENVTNPTPILTCARSLENRPYIMIHLSGATDKADSGIHFSAVRNPNTGSFIFPYTDIETSLPKENPELLLEAIRFRDNQIRETVKKAVQVPGALTPDLYNAAVLGIDESLKRLNKIGTEDQKKEGESIYKELKKFLEAQHAASGVGEPNDTTLKGVKQLNQQDKERADGIFKTINDESTLSEIRDAIGEITTIVNKIFDRGQRIQSYAAAAATLGKVDVKTEVDIYTKILSDINAYITTLEERRQLLEANARKNAVAAAAADAKAQKQRNNTLRAAVNEFQEEKEAIRSNLQKPGIKVANLQTKYRKAKTKRNAARSQWLENSKLGSLSILPNYYPRPNENTGFETYLTREAAKQANANEAAAKQAEAEAAAKQAEAEAAAKQAEAEAAAKQANANEAAAKQANANEAAAKQAEAEAADKQAAANEAKQRNAEAAKQAAANEAKRRNAEAAAANKPGFGGSYTAVTAEPPLPSGAAVPKSPMLTGAGAAGPKSIITGQEILKKTGINIKDTTFRNLHSAYKIVKDNLNTFKKSPNASKQASRLEFLTNKQDEAFSALKTYLTDKYAKKESDLAAVQTTLAQTTNEPARSTLNQRIKEITAEIDEINRFQRELNASRVAGTDTLAPSSVWKPKSTRHGRRRTARKTRRNK